MVTGEHYFSKEYSVCANKDAWVMLKEKYGSKHLVGLVAIVRGHHDVFLNKHVDSKKIL